MASTKQNYLHSYEDYNIVPDILNKVPDEILNVCFDGKVQAKCGNTLTPTEVKDQPELSWKAMRGEFYTIMMIDPDAPSNKQPSMRNWLHWLVVNVPWFKVECGQIKAEYVGAGPPKDSGCHRYIVLVFKQSNKIRMMEQLTISKCTDEGRPNFNLSEFIYVYRLGQPVAGNFFLAEYDEYVERLYKQLGMGKEKTKKNKNEEECNVGALEKKKGKEEKKQATCSKDRWKKSSSSKSTEEKEDAAKKTELSKVDAADEKAAEKSKEKLVEAVLPENTAEKSKEKLTKAVSAEKTTEKSREMLAESKPKEKSKLSESTSAEKPTDKSKEGLAEAVSVEKTAGKSKEKLEEAKSDEKPAEPAT